MSVFTVVYVVADENKHFYGQAVHDEQLENVSRTKNPRALQANLYCNSTRDASRSLDKVRLISDLGVQASGVSLWKLATSGTRRTDRFGELLSRFSVVEISRIRLMDPQKPQDRNRDRDRGIDLVIRKDGIEVLGRRLKRVGIGRELELA